MQTLDTINPHQRLTGWLSITVGEWLSMLPGIVRQLPEKERPALLVKLFVTLQAEGVDVGSYLDYLVEALCEFQPAAEG